MESNVAKELETEFLPFVRVYKDGSVERLSGSPFVPPSMKDPATGVSSKDITISQNPLIRARLFLPKLNESESDIKIPILVYYHGGGFLFESAFSADHHRFLNSLVSQAKVVAVSVEYRLAPENPLPAAYEDSWAALQWVSCFSSKDNNSTIEEPWLSSHGDFERVFIGGDSAGANIVHNIAMRAGKESLSGGVEILGALLTHPYFWGSKPTGSEQSIPHLVWNIVYPNAPGGIDNPMINPVVPELAPSLEGLGCCRLLVSVAEKDWLRDRGVWYCEAVKKSGWKGEVELIEIEGEDHAFHIGTPGTENANRLIKRLADFLSKK